MPDRNYAMMIASYQSIFSHRHLYKPAEEPKGLWDNAIPNTQADPKQAHLKQRPPQQEAKVDDQLRPSQLAVDESPIKFRPPREAARHGLSSSQGVASQADDSPSLFQSPPQHKSKQESPGWLHG
eukprot:TRINITY_DN11537_c1_g1_i3.p3 TRINITY_DN11537_c1_g1~~TRINITY_DN11537_c1_g1_i3.p3  ORF type:complete len:125 (+),score=29.88 TRINITY_DN11537_c1_g1_i3:2024-2398(+)